MRRFSPEYRNINKIRIFKCVFQKASYTIQSTFLFSEVLPSLLFLFLLFIKFIISLKEDSSISILTSYLAKVKVCNFHFFSDQTEYIYLHILYIYLPLNLTVLKLEPAAWIDFLSQIAIDLMYSHSNTFALVIESHRESMNIFMDFEILLVYFLFPSNTFSCM